MLLVSSHLYTSPSIASRVSTVFIFHSSIARQDGWLHKSAKIGKVHIDPVLVALQYCNHRMRRFFCLASHMLKHVMPLLPALCIHCLVAASRLALSHSTRVEIHRIFKLHTIPIYADLFLIGLYCFVSCLYAEVPNSRLPRLLFLLKFVSFQITSFYGPCFLFKTLDFVD